MTLKHKGHFDLGGTQETKLRAILTANERESGLVILPGGEGSSASGSSERT
ncbi:MAG: hypothetical protein JWM32_2822 [Verrucomicrobia bacterium]|nr:hypothetical protein [Verrucomicrobiota bacterium]